MEEVLIRYRYAIGSLLLILIIAGSAFLLWRENRWKPAMESRLAALESDLLDFEDSFTISEAVAATEPAQTATTVNPSSLIKGSTSTAKTTTAKKATTTTTSSTAGKVAGTSTSASSTPTTPAPSAPAQPQIVNINTGTLEQLDTLPGIGPVYAQRIIDYRVANGGFKTIAEIKNVKGIGDATFDKMKDLITI